MKKLKLIALLLFIFIGCANAQQAPSEIYGALFREVQMKSVFDDSKTFADCNPKYTPEAIVEKYQQQKGKKDFDLAAFVGQNFEIPEPEASTYTTNPDHSVKAHINELWPILTIDPETKKYSSLIDLPQPYVVPGGRFREVYYWDSYFTMLGLQSANKDQLMQNMVDNFAYLIDEYGFVPNGNRTYYLSRSQPPYFALMVKLLAEEKGESVLLRYLPQLEKEYKFWMRGIEKLNSTSAYQRVVKMPDGAVLNRYWDNRPAPRDESYKEDIRLSIQSSQRDSNLYRNVRAACESGWDFSSRWLDNKFSLSTIKTTDYVPVDLNSLLYFLEKTIAEASDMGGDMKKSKAYKKLAEQRRVALEKYCWNVRKGFYADFHIPSQRPSDKLTAAGNYPLFLKIASEAKAGLQVIALKQSLLTDYGVMTTTEESDQQWDHPNGWAPLQWATIVGLQNYGLNGLAEKIAKSWVKMNIKVYRDNGKLVEKYNLNNTQSVATGGEYPAQDGFGWTNGVILGLMDEFKMTERSLFEKDDKK